MYLLFIGHFTGVKMPLKIIDLNNPDTYIVCPICNEKMATLHWSHTKKHGLKPRDLLDKFNHLRLVCKNTSDVLSDNKLNHWKDKSYRDATTSILRFNALDPIKSADRNLRMKEFYKSDRGKILCRSRYDSIRKFYETEEGKSFRSEKAVKQSKYGDFFGRRKFHLHKGFKLKSKWELEFAKFLDSIGLNYQYEHKWFKYTYDGRPHHYLPDFYIEGLGYIEIKPSVFVGDITRVKLDAVMSAGDDIVLVTELNWSETLIRLREFSNRFSSMKVSL